MADLKVKNEQELKELERTKEYLEQHASKEPDTHTENEKKLMDRIDNLLKIVNELEKANLEKALRINKLENQLDNIRRTITVKEHNIFHSEETWAQIVIYIYEDGEYNEYRLISGTPRDIKNPNSDFMRYIKLFGLEEKLKSLNID